MSIPYKILADESGDPYAALPALVINGVEKDDQAAKDGWGALLTQYCKLDTVSMVLVFEHWRRATSSA